MRVFIDASNISRGGGVTHLVELLRAADPVAHQFSSIVIWSSQSTLRQIANRPWLLKRSSPVMEGGYLRRALWQRTGMGKLAKESGCDLVFAPGGSYATDFRPVVTMHRNLLPFEWPELLRYGVSATTVRLILLRLAQIRSISRANGTIFLTRYAQAAAMRAMGLPRGETAIIPHGVDGRFFMQPRLQRSIDDCSKNPFRLVYVSIVDTYKHQWHLVDAVAKLRAGGMPVALDLVGPAYPPALRRLKKTMRRVDPRSEFISYKGTIPYEEIQSNYETADVAVFASSCETFGQILTEYMAAGLPIACSNRSAMRELLAEGGVYFDPEDPEHIANTLSEFIASQSMRSDKSRVSFQRAHEFSWQRCASDTFAFLNRVYRKCGSPR